MNPHILRLRHMREQTEAVGETMQHEAQRFTALAEREAPRVVSSFQLFQTPEVIADRMAMIADPQDHERWLEPSAGLGRLYRAIRHRSAAEITLVENAAECAGELYREMQGDDCVTLIQQDFLQCTVEQLGLFDGILMNPPFKNGIDRTHVRKALSLLKPNGRLVSLCYNGTKQQAAFKNNPEWTWEELEPRSFRSEGTGASVAMITHRAE